VRSSLSNKSEPENSNDLQQPSHRPTIFNKFLKPRPFKARL
jgi:hypothetical protein